MIRSVIGVAVLGALAWLAVLVADHPGRIAVQWGVYSADVSVGQAVLLLLVYGFVFYLLLRLVKFIFGAVRLARKHTAQKQLRKGIEAASQGFVALASGHTAQAMRLGKRAGRYLPRHPLTLLLQAQTAQAQGDPDKAEACYKAMLEQQDTAFLGATRLWEQAREQGDLAAEIRHAEQAYQLQPDSPQAVRALVATRMREGRWQDAQITAYKALTDKVLPRDEANRYRQEALIGRSRTAADPQEAMDLARQGYSLDKTFAPMVVRYAECVAVGHPHRARRIVEQAWVRRPDPLLLAVWQGDLTADLTVEKKLERAAALLRRHPGDAAAQLMVAELHVAAGQFSAARPLLENLSQQAPSPAVNELLAQVMIEETGDVVAAERLRGGGV